MDQLSTETERQGSIQPKKQFIEWRRAQVLELSSQGRTERDIATILKVGAATVSRDIAYLNKQAEDNLKNHINQRLPAQYQKSLNGLNQVLTIAWNIVLLGSINHNNKLQALSLISDCYKYQMDLCTNAGVISDAMKFVNQKREMLDPLKSIKTDEDEKEKVQEQLGSENIHGVVG
jgi:uncharacterized protein YerC